MISGCKDSQTSADIQGNSMGAMKAAGAMTTAFRHAINPTISCEEMLLRMRQFLKRNHYQQVPQMSSEQFIQLDSSFVGYATKGKQKRTIQMTAPMGVTPAMQSHVVMPKAHGSMSPVPGPMQLSSFNHPMHLDTEKYVMDSRINQLEEQIANLRKQQQSPIPGAYDAFGGRYGQPSPMQPMGAHFPQSPGMQSNYGSSMFGMTTH